MKPFEINQQLFKIIEMACFEMCCSGESCHCRKITDNPCVWWPTVSISLFCFEILVLTRISDFPLKTGLRTLFGHCAGFNMFDSFSKTFIAFIASIAILAQEVDQDAFALNAAGVVSSARSWHCTLTFLIVLRCFLSRRFLVCAQNQRGEGRGSAFVSSLLFLLGWLPGWALFWKAEPGSQPGAKQNAWWEDLEVTAGE